MENIYADKTLTIRQIDKLFADLNRMNVRVEDLEKRIRKMENENEARENMVYADSQYVNQNGKTEL